MLVSMSIEYKHLLLSMRLKYKLFLSFIWINYLMLHAYTHSIYFTFVYILKFLTVTTCWRLREYHLILHLLEVTLKFKISLDEEFGESAISGGLGEVIFLAIHLQVHMYLSKISLLPLSFLIHTLKSCSQYSDQFLFLLLSFLESRFCYVSKKNLHPLPKIRVPPLCSKLSPKKWSLNHSKLGYSNLQRALKFLGSWETQVKWSFLQ